MPSGDTLLYLAPYTLGPEEVDNSTKRKKMNVFERATVGNMALIKADLFSDIPQTL